MNFSSSGKFSQGKDRQKQEFHKHEGLKKAHQILFSILTCFQVNKFHLYVASHQTRNPGTVTHKFCALSSFVKPRKYFIIFICRYARDSNTTKLRNFATAAF